MAPAGRPCLAVREKFGGTAKGNPENDQLILEADEVATTQAAAEHNESGHDDQERHQPAGPATCPSPARALDAPIVDKMRRILCAS